MSPEHAPRLLKQPGAERVTTHCGLSDAPGEGGEVSLAEAVIAVSQQTEPGDESQAIMLSDDSSVPTPTCP